MVLAEHLLLGHSCDELLAVGGVWRWAARLGGHLGVALRVERL